MVLAGSKTKRLSSVNHTTKTIHHHYLDHRRTYTYAPTYKLSKFFVPLLTPLALNEYTVKESFLFAEELVDYDSNLVMANFDVELLFTNIPLQETIDLFVELLFCVMISPTLTILP